MTLTYDIVSRIIVSGAYLLYFLRLEFGVWIHLGMAEWCIPSLVTLTFTLTSDFISRFFVSGAYLLSSNVSYAKPMPPGGIRHVTLTCLFYLAIITCDPPPPPPPCARYIYLTITKLIVLNQKAESIINALG